MGGEIVINEGVGSIFKKILEGIAGAIKAVIKAIGGFISNIIDKLKSIMNRSPNNSNPTTNKSTTINNNSNPTTNKSTTINNNSNPTTNKSDSIEKFKKEKYEFLNTKISDIVKTNPYGSLGFKAYMETYSVLDYLLDSFNSGYLTKSLPILIKDSFPSNFKNIDFKIKLNSDELINYDFVCNLSNKDGAKIEDFFKNNNSGSLNKFNQLKMDNISKIEKSFKNSIKALEDMLKIIQSLSDYFDNIDEDNDIDYFYNLLNKYNDTIGKIEIPGIKELKDRGSKNFKTIENNINSIKKANNKKQFVTLAKNDFAKESMNCLLNDTKDAVSIIKNHIILLSKYIPLHIKLKKDLSAIDMYISNTKNKIMKKYNVTNWNI